ncbi:hypothetical protein [Actinacidiphila acidipaludis]|uniref:Uncharacterized protein n=1 Tax=Actinacidiphila acidipaludis TaxID=2873382 RepID=A0ABS7QF41_9ACTN|nr:hypothetical protein [Streptomyces acidipaludis]MBY8881782.1 hypothetical protein [Streptomyces acidipaludis]
MSEAVEQAGGLSVAWETAELEGGPADGAKIRVTGRPRVLQVTAECPVEEGSAQALRVAAVYVYRRKHQEPLRYAWDWASP